MSWCIRGSYVLDRLFGTDLAADVDVFYEDKKPTPEDVEKILKCREKIFDIHEAGFEPKINLDLYSITDAGTVMYKNKVVKSSKFPRCLTISKIYGNTHLHCDDCIRILKTFFKYFPKITLSSELEQNIKKELQESIESHLSGDIIASVLPFMTQSVIYMKIRQYLANTCSMPESVMSELPEL